MNSSTGEVSAFISWSIFSDLRPQLGIKPSKMRLFKGHYIQTTALHLVTIIFSPQGPGCYYICPGRAHMGKKQDPRWEEECRAAGDCCRDGSKLQPPCKTGNFPVFSACNSVITL